jgi:hypothetical protein
VFVVKLIVHPVKQTHIFAHHVQMVMHLRIQIVLKQQKNVILVNILILLKIGKSEEEFLYKNKNDCLDVDGVIFDV